MLHKMHAAIKTQGGWRPYRALADTDDVERRLGVSVLASFSQVVYAKHKARSRYSQAVHSGSRRKGLYTCNNIPMMDLTCSELGVRRKT